MPDIRLSFGPMLLGVFFNMILYGILVMQMYHYYLSFKRDAPWIKYLVIYVFIIESLNTGCDMAIMYQPLIENFGLPNATKFFPTLFPSEPMFIVAVSTPIQIFLAWRIKLLTKSNILSVVVVILSITSLAGAIYTGVLVAKIQLFSRKPELHWPALVWLLSACIADIIITMTLVINLSKRRTGFVATDDVISKIIRTTIQTGMLTAFFAAADVISFLALPHTAINFIWDIALSKLYANCLLSTLNARQNIQDGIGLQSAQTLGVNRRRETHGEGSGHGLGPSVYELDTQKSLNHDKEYGITITKMVETRQDSKMLESTQ